MNSLQKSLTINAIFSSISGILLIFLHKTTAKLFLVEQSTTFWIIGIILIIFSITIVIEIYKQRKKQVFWIIYQDLLWVISSIVLLLFNPFNISFGGNLIIGIIALIVLFMAINQYVAVKKSF